MDATRFRAGRRALASADRLEIVGEAADIDAAVAPMRGTSPDFVLLGDRAPLLTSSDERTTPTSSAPAPRRQR